jgi:hypothetical protein
MSGSVFEAGSPRHLLSRENPRPTMAKADLTEREKREHYGQILKRAQQILGKSRKEMADLLGVDEGQLGRWYSGVENPQLWRYHSAISAEGDQLSPRDAVRIAEAEDARDHRLVIETVIRMVR